MSPVQALPLFPEAIAIAIDLAWARAIVKHRTELFQFSLVKHLLQL